MLDSETLERYCGRVVREESWRTLPFALLHLGFEGGIWTAVSATALVVAGANYRFNRRSTGRVSVSTERHPP